MYGRTPLSCGPCPRGTERRRSGGRPPSGTCGGTRPCVGRDRADHLVGELFRCQVDDALARKAVVDLMTDRMHEVSLAKSDASVEEQWVVAVTWCLGNRLGCGVSKLRVVPDDER